MSPPLVSIVGGKKTQPSMKSSTIRRSISVNLRVITWLPFAAVILPISVRAELTNRWSFNNPAGPAADNTILLDSISGAIATVEGEDSTFTGAALTLTGTASGNHSAAFLSGYVNLPNGIISSKTNLTIEVWAAPHSAPTYARVFDFGRVAGPGYGGGAPGELLDVTGQGMIPGATSAEDSLYFSFSRGNNLNDQRMEAMINGINGLNIDTSIPTTEDTLYHYVCTFEDGVGASGASGGRVTWYRDGVQFSTADVDFHLSEMEDVNNWLGRSQWTNDFNANASYDECRIYDHALSAAEISANLSAGPDVLTDPPDPVDPPVPDNLWAFTTPAQSEAPSGVTFTDEIGGLLATLRGNGGALSGGAVVLPGSTDGNQPASTISAYIDLPNGIATATNDVTFEAWATPLSSKTWQRLFDFGRANTTHGPDAELGEIIDSAANPGGFGGYDNLSLTLNAAGDIDSQQLEGQIGGSPPQFSNSNADTTLGVEYHYVLVVEDGVGAHGAGGCQARWFRNGVLQNSEDFPFHLDQLSDVNNWIGRSMYAGDSNSNLSLNEFRIYRRVITPAEISASFAAGPDPSVGPPEPPAPAPIPTRRWSFNSAPGTSPAGTTFLDEATGEIATVRGNDATLDGDQLILPGTTGGNESADDIAAYLDLPNGFISSRPSLTIEAWITPLSSNTWQRIFDFGNTSLTSGPGAAVGEIIDSGVNPGGFVANDNLFLSFNINGSLGAHRQAAKLGGGAETGSSTDLSSITDVGTEYHFALTVEDGAGASGAAGSRVRWYRDGTLYGSSDLAYRLPDLADVNNWIGRSMWAADSNSHIAINELRVHDRAISKAEVSTSFNEGPHVEYDPPVANADTATLHSGQKVLIDVLANDTGSPISETLQIITPPTIGTVEVQPSGKILYTHDGSGTAPVTFSYQVSGIGGDSDLGSVDLTISTQLRISGAKFNIPLSPPQTAITLVDAFPGVSFDEALCFASPPGDTARLFVCERSGILKVIPDISASEPSSEIVLDLNQVISSPVRDPSESIQGGANGECGLLGLAFHPDFQNNGYFYVFYSVVKEGTFGFFQRVSRFTVPPENLLLPAPTADESSEVILIDQYDQGANHQGGDMHFGSDGYLYIAVGDEENPNDFRLNSQRIDKDFFAAMLRIDVDKRPGNPEPNPHASIPTDSGIAGYSIPADNPFVVPANGGNWDGTYNGEAIADQSLVRTEFYATGLRSPWRFSIDPETDEIWLGDVGQDRYEEVNIIENGKNYGWVFREGAHDINTSNGGWPNIPDPFISTDPIYEYVHNNMVGDPSFKGNSVIGGRVYRGSRIESLNGSYIFGDQVSGHIWSLTRNPGSPPTVTRIAGLPYLSNFGEDPATRDILVSDYFGGRIMRIVSVTPSGTFPTTLSATGLFADLTDLSPQPGLLPYEPNITFWSDHAVKRRWFAIPNDSDQMTWNREGPWIYPEGQLFVKHFDLELERGNPATKKRIETRLLVRNESGTYGVSYRWNESETEATLVEDGGVSFPLQITDEGFPHTQIWQIPSRSQCLNCHTPNAGHALSFNTRQLNRSGNINGFTGNQIDILDTAGYLSNPPDADLPKHPELSDLSAPLEARVRAYFDVNCAYCHRPEGGGPGWDGRASRTLEETGIIHGPVAAAKSAGDKMIVPGDVPHSVILSRIAETNGYSRMPPLATSELDQDAITLITEWIQTELPNHPLYDQWRDTYFASGDPDGAKEIDADQDGLDNYTEYLLGSSPLTGTGAWQAMVGEDGSTLSFLRKAYRIYDIQSSEDLNTWESWNGSENHDNYSISDTPVEIEIPSDSRRFFRFDVSEP